MTEPFVRPDVAAFLKYANSVPGPRVHQLDPATARALVKAMNGVADVAIGPLAVRRDIAMPGPHGGSILLRLYDTREQREAGPVLVFFHGGGWVLGDIDSYDPACAEIARALDLPVISVDYRLAPEAPWPAGPDDCEAAARWIAGTPAGLGVTPTALVLAGDSAGGNLAIITALALRDTPAALPVIALWTLYPAADFVTHYPSYKQFEDGYLLTGDAIRWFGEQYRADANHWRASPMHANLAGLPPTLVTTAGLDPLRDQGRAYASALAKAGVTVSYREAHGNLHGYLTLRRAIPSSQGDVAANLIALGALITEATA